MAGMSRSRRRPLNRTDSLHVRAAHCWIALGNLEQAQGEIQSVRPRNRRHPEVQSVYAELEAATRYVTTLIQDDRILAPYWDAEGELQIN
jgi:hypothetical protein